MASVYRQTYKRPVPAGAELVERKGVRVARWSDTKGRRKTAPLSADGLSVVLEYRCWYASWPGADGRRRTAKGSTDREATQAMAERMERAAARQRQGIAGPDAARQAAPLSEMIEEYLAELAALGRSQKHRYNMRLRLTRTAAEAGWPTLAAVRPDGMARWMVRLHLDGKAQRTVNHWLESARAFTRWAAARGYTDADPLARVPKAEGAQPRRRRRALTEAELGRLLAAAPARRRLLYLAAVWTGLRRAELRALRWGHVEGLGAAGASIRLPGHEQKSGRGDVLPVGAVLAAALLAEWRRLRPAAHEPVLFVPTKLKGWKNDLRKAGIAFLDQDGRRADFHALRLTLCTRLARAGVPVRTAMQLMRHSDIRLTTKVYVDPTLLDAAGAIDSLPALTNPARRRKA
jgi:integrase